MGWLRRILAIILIVIAIIYGLYIIFGAEFFGSMAATLLIFGTANAGWIAALALIGATVVDPGTVNQAFSSVGKAVGTVAGAVVGGVGAAIGSSGILGIGLLILAGVWILPKLLEGSDKSESKKERERISSASSFNPEQEDDIKRIRARALAGES